MKKILIYVLLVTIIFTLLASMPNSPLDNIFKKDEPVTNNIGGTGNVVTNPSVSTNIPVPVVPTDQISENCFYYSVNNSNYSTNDISEIPSGSYGFMKVDGACYFGVKYSASAVSGVTVYNDLAPEGMITAYYSDDLENLYIMNFGNKSSVTSDVVVFFSKSDSCADPSAYLKQLLDGAERLPITVYSKLDSGVYYYEVNGSLVKSADLSKVPHGTRGFFIKNGVAYFCVKVDPHNSMGYMLEVDDISAESPTITSAEAFTIDMSTLNEEVSFTGIVTDNHGLMVYAKSNNYYEAQQLHDLLVSSYVTSLQTADPVLPGPSGPN